eukprot:7387192-Prymnesium_polylepis.2
MEGGAGWQRWQAASWVWSACSAADTAAPPGPGAPSSCGRWYPPSRGGCAAATSAVETHPTHGCCWSRGSPETTPAAAAAACGGLTTRPTRTRRCPVMVSLMRTEASRAGCVAACASQAACAFRSRS